MKFNLCLKKIVNLRLINTFLCSFLFSINSFSASEFISNQYHGPLKSIEPEKVNFSKKGLRNIERFVNDEINKNRIPGAVVGIVKDGKLVYLNAFGKEDPDSNKPMSISSVFAAASMTKPMVAVGALQLTEQGKLPLFSDVSQYIPEIAKMQVEEKSDDGSFVLKPQFRSMKIHDLMRHTSGLTYGGRKDTVGNAAKLYPPGSELPMLANKEEFIKRISSLPLVYQPGTSFEYSVSFEMLGAVIETLTQQTLGSYLKNSLWDPMGMFDTGFSTSVEQRNRLAKPFKNDPLTGKPQRIETVEVDPTFHCGGGCAFTTVPDYLKFGVMLVNNGKFQKNQILSPAFVKLMLSNHISTNIKNNVAKVEPHRDGFGFGLGVAVRTQDGVASVPGDIGEATWNGAYGTGFVVDPAQKLVIVFATAAPGDIRKYYREQLQDIIFGSMITPN
jgi:CubicO group peptidase (beta-lactamase class C family)